VNLGNKKPEKAIVNQKRGFFISTYDENTNNKGFLHKFSFLSVT